MGALRATAIASHDIRLLKQDICNDVMAQYDDWHDMENGPSNIDVATAEMEYLFNDLDPDDAEKDLKEYMKQQHEERKARNG